MSEKSLADRTIDALAVGRIAAGALSWISPSLTSKVFGMDADGGQSRYAWRLFGVRDVAIGLGTLLSSGAQRRAFVTAGLACDVGDGAAGAVAMSRGDFTRSTAGAPVTVPVLAVALGAWTLRSISR
ncbi:hypothetical protein AB4Z42_07085 [Mycobacterium sp. 2YAF39]|uniref:hypothetical protein n=1 Tax=Mycobacterium sp. 2YAF39 TaxID=3233033 RepID=UPI003F946A50